MALTHTAAQQSTTIQTEKANKAAALANFSNADGADRARYLAEIQLAEAKVRQAQNSPTNG